MQHKVEGADAPFDIVWDSLGVAHVYATSVADAYRGMGYAAGSERLWQTHLSCAFANGEAAALLGERWVRQDALQRACNVHGGQTPLLASSGDWVVDAYLQGLNSWVRGLAEVPPEFLHANAEPREFTRADIAARYRFTCWFQHKSWTEKMLLGRLMATHGVDYFRDHVLHFSATDEALISELNESLRAMDMGAIELAYPEIKGDPAALAAVSALSGSNNWAVQGRLSESGKPMLATDPHQPHAIPNTFFYVHLHAPGWDAFGAAFPGVPYFMMGYTRDVAWGLTTGFVDCYDVYVEQLRTSAGSEKFTEHRTHAGWQPVKRRTETIDVKGGSSHTVDIVQTSHGVLLESLQASLGMRDTPASQLQEEVQTALYWSFAQTPTSAGALARLPLAKTAAEFGDLLFENDVCPLVNNIICVDAADNLRRFVATTTPARASVTGSVPLAGWREDCEFPLSKAAQLVVEVNPESGFSYTANNDTMEERGEFYIHNFPIHSARADRIGQLLGAAQRFSLDDFQSMQLDLVDLRAVELLPQLLAVLRGSTEPELLLACELLEQWDARAAIDSSAACIYYLYMGAFWQRDFMREALGDEALSLLPLGAPGLNRFDIASYLEPESPWKDHQALLERAVRDAMIRAVRSVTAALGTDTKTWRWGDLQQISFKHSLARFPHWQDMQVGPDPLGGSATTLAMAMHVRNTDETPGDEPLCRVYHGPAYRLCVDLADPDHARFVIAGGNGGRADSPFVANQYTTWLAGEYFTLNLQRAELTVVDEWSCGS